MSSHIEFGRGAPPLDRGDADLGWELVEVDDERISIRFVGHLVTEGGVASARRVADRLARAPGRLVLDVQEMTGYDRGARVAWQELLWPQRANIEALVLVGGNAVVRMGASVLAMFLGAPLERVGGAQVSPRYTADGDAPPDRVGDRREL